MNVKCLFALVTVKLVSELVTVKFVSESLTVKIVSDADLALIYRIYDIIKASRGSILPVAMGYLFFLLLFTFEHMNGAISKMAA